MRYLILGDTHANWPFMSQHVFTHVKARGILFDEIIQVGDLGYYESTMGYFMHYVRKFGCPFHFIDGNHEDHRFLNATHMNLNKFGVFYHPRGDITTLSDGTKIGWMGGAFNVDRPQEFWPDGSQNFPKKEEVDLFINKINSMNGVDLMVTHSCPHSIGVGVPGHPAFTPGVREFIEKLGYISGPLHDCGDVTLTDLWKGINQKPKEWIFGHMHMHHHAVVGTTHFRCVGTCDGQYEPRIYIYDTTTKTVLE